MAIALALWALLHPYVRPNSKYEALTIQTAPSIPAQLIFASGDRYLAANISAWRATVVGGVGLSADTHAVLAKTQQDASWMNPWHEDNYYTAAAVLPWEGYVDEAQIILWRATEARQADLLPPFLYAFNQMNFRGDVSGAVDALRIAERKAVSDGERRYFHNLADRWEKRKDDLSFAELVLQNMAAKAHSTSLKSFIELQLKRLRGLAIIREGSSRYLELFKSPPNTLNDLVTSGILAEVPYDPTGLGYEIRHGIVLLKERTTHGK